MTDAYEGLPSSGNVAQDDGWVAWGHNSTKTRVRKKRGGHSSGHSRSSSSGSGSTHSGGHRHRHRHHHHRHRVRNRVIGALVAVLVVALLGCTGAFAFSAYGVAGDAQELVAQVTVLQEGLSGGDAQAMQESAEVIGERAASMAATTSGPLWTAAAVLPVVGTDVSNIRALATAVDDLSQNALTPLAAAAGGFELDEVLADGSVDVAVIAQLADAVTVAAPAVQRTCTTIDEMQQGRIGQVNEAIESAGEQLSTLNALCTGLSELAPYLEAMLGADEDRTYLIMAHNTSELKCSGGFTGSIGTLTISDGTLTLGHFGSFNKANRDLENTGDTSDRVKVSSEEDALFTWTYGVHAGDSGVNPDFPREAEMSKEMYETVHPNKQIDGVIALDSQVLQDFLALAGSVTTADGTVVDGSNCVQVLGHDIYWDYFAGDDISDDAGDEADALFAEVAGLAFDKVVANIGGVGIMGLADVLAANVEEHRLQVWMLDEGEQQAIEALGASGSINQDAAVPELGVFIESLRASKMGWWTTMNTTASKVSNNNDGSVTYTVTTTIVNSMTDAEVAQASSYIRGVGEDTPGSQKYALYLYAPAGGTVSDVSVSTTHTEYDGYFTMEGTQVGKVRFWVDPQETVTVTYTVTTSTTAEGELQVRQTPMAHDSATTTTTTATTGTTTAAEDEGTDGM